MTLVIVRGSAHAYVRADTMTWEMAGGGEDRNCDTGAEWTDA